ncbi:acyl-CoA/acyl-ACP dehydrogenase [Rhodococcus ruber]|uniref:Acyl-CoA/acyl-ACP dehydrogenase n=1 Tax=Rhodococcus ruber TaxID=1830 RepID=A0ABT4MER0_9NOCA|nr:acyl-CoA dehydrogenase family protein [Rhodococcus ruber]MCZ4519479.1 acyl-CoA/acyl-ACP dehydrogenase [Rhodococcus ruber]
MVTRVFAPHDELVELRTIFRGFLTKRSGEEQVRKTMETASGYEIEFWRDLAGLGVLSAALPEEYGGDGFGVTAAGVVLEEMGADLTCSPYLSTMTAAQYLVASGDVEACHRYLPAIGDGSVRGTVLTPTGRVRTPQVEAAGSNSSWRLNGTVGYVVDGHTADLFVVVAATTDGPRMFVVEPESTSVSSQPMSVLDRTRKLAEVNFVDTEATLLRPSGDVAQRIAAAADRACVLLACEQAGGASRVLNMAVQYSKERVQFGRPIGSFQSIKHILADLLVTVESAKTAARYTAGMADTSDAEIGAAANLARFYCSDAFVEAANTNIQVHGGIGFTWEHPAHLYLRRARTSAVLLGDSQFHRAKFIDRTLAAQEDHS